VSKPVSSITAQSNVLPAVVLDTQVVLDWLVFHDAGCAALSFALEAGAVRWIATQAMRNELDHVLERGIAAAWRANRETIAQLYDRFAVMLVPGLPPGPPVHCADPSDQMFIDLALSAGASWLVTRDHALLALAKSAKLHGVAVLRPGDWLQVAEMVS
jgi:predicted nucleic acid-binding protein